MKQPRGSHSKTSLGLLFVILAVGAFLRLHNLEFMEFKGDEAFNARKAQALVLEGELPLTSSVSSVGVHEPPVFMYLLALPFLVSDSPVIATAFVALANVAGIALCYAIVSALYTRRSALLAAAFYAANPWQVLFSRKLWTQDLLAPFLLLFLYLIVRAGRSGRSGWLVAAGLVLGLALQLHLSSVYFLAVVALLLARHWRQIDKRALLFAAALGALTFLPYLVFQFSTGLADFTTAAQHLDRGRGVRLDAIRLPFALVGTGGFDYALGESLRSFEERIWQAPLLDGLIAVALACSMLFAFYKWRDQRVQVLLVWLVMGTLAIVFNAEALHEHYFVSMLPLYFVLLGVGSDRLLEWVRGAWQYGVYAAVLAVLLHQVAFGVGLLRFVEDESCIRGSYGPPFAHRARALSEALDRLGPPENEVDLGRIHVASCRCQKCDLRATQYLLNYYKD